MKIYLSTIAITAIMLSSSVGQSDLQASQSIVSTGGLLDPIVDARNYNSFTEAINAIGSSSKTLLITSPQVITTKVTVGPNVNLVVTNAGSFLKSGLGALIIKGEFTVGRYQVFNGFAVDDVAFLDGRTVYPEWWGAKSDGATDCTGAFNGAVASIKKSGGTVHVQKGNEYRISRPILIVDINNIKITGGGRIRQTDGTKHAVLIHGGQNLELSDITFYGTFETSGPIGNMPTVSIYPGFAQSSKNIVIQNVVFKYNSNDAIYVGGDNSATGATDNISLKNCRMEYGLSFLLAAGVTNLTVDGILAIHRSAPPVGSGMSQDEDISVWSYNGRSSENISISNIIIQARGDSANTYTGRPKLAFGISGSGLSFYNLVVNNVAVKDNIGLYTPHYGSNGSTLYISDVNADKNGFKNAQFSNISFFNSPGIFIEAHNLSFANISLDTFPQIKGFTTSGRAIDSTQSVSTSGCKFANFSIRNWSGTPIVYTAEGGVIFNGLTVTNSHGSVWTSKDSIYNDMAFDDVGDETYGALFVQNSAPNITVNNAIFKNCPHVAIKDRNNLRLTGGRFSNVLFYNNRKDTDMVLENQILSGSFGRNR